MPFGCNSPVLATCGPRHRSVKGPLVYMVNFGAPPLPSRSRFSSNLPLVMSSISSRLYGCPFDSASASSFVTSRHSNFWFSLMIRRIRCSKSSRSSSVNARGNPKS